MELRNYIDGVFANASGDATLDVYEPATGQVYAQAPDSGAPDVACAVTSGKEAFMAWAGTPAAERAAILNRIADLVDANAEALAQAESKDSGKPITAARTIDIPRAAANCRFFAAAATQFASESHAMEAGAINYTLRQPLGVVGCISPWNLPLYLFTWKVAPALASGNCVVGKPSEITPVTAFLFAELCHEAGLPPGVLNVLHGHGPRVGQALVDHADIAAVSFTGGTKTGELIARSAAPRFKKLSLELGGKNPTLVFADCDFDLAVSEAVRASFANQGEICLCGSRVLVEAEIYDRFRDAFISAARAYKPADPILPETKMGALVSEQHLEKVLDHIAIARNEGGNILTGGRRADPPNERCKDGWFVEPTVIDGLDGSCRTNQEEVFGPLATLIPFADEDEAVATANGTPYGLAASVFSANVSRCHRLATRLDAGLIWINTWMLRDLRTPMGGMKQSGAGREGGFEAMRFFTEAKNICVKFDV